MNNMRSALHFEGGEGAWNSTFQPAEYQVLLAGKDPVATDNVASYLMGNDPESDKFMLPDGYVNVLIILDYYMTEGWEQIR
jgi:hypothetical protein